MDVAGAGAVCARLLLCARPAASAPARMMHIVATAREREVGI
jgi:hypothetical protein